MNVCKVASRIRLPDNWKIWTILQLSASHLPSLICLRYRAL